MNQDQDAILLETSKIVVVIPCYRARPYILAVLAKIPAYVWKVIVVDDACPDKTYQVVEEHNHDSRVMIVQRPQNGGVGAAMVTGYQKAVDIGAHVIVKMDADDQMPSALIPHFVLPILKGQADYTKGNRFFDADAVSQMPFVRLFGNAVLSFMTKLSSGYWNSFDPTNGYTAIHAKLLTVLPLAKLSPRYFFESDMLFRLGTFKAKVVDIPMRAEYPHDSSSLSIGKIIAPFLMGHFKNTCRRIVYNYYLRDFSVASILLPLGVISVGFGFSFGLWHWILADSKHLFASAGTVMLAALPIIVGVQSILSFLQFDYQQTPQASVSNDLHYAVLKNDAAIDSDNNQKSTHA